MNAEECHACNERTGSCLSGRALLSASARSASVECSNGGRRRGGGRFRPQHQVGCLLADHDRSGVGVGRRNRRHDRRVHDTQRRNAVNPQHRVDHGHRVGTHSVGAHRMPGRLRGLSNIGGLLIIRQDVDARSRFALDIAPDRRLAHCTPGQAQRVRRDLLNAFLAQIPRIDHPRGHGLGLEDQIQTISKTVEITGRGSATLAAPHRKLQVTDTVVVRAVVARVARDAGLLARRQERLREPEGSYLRRIGQDLGKADPHPDRRSASSSSRTRPAIRSPSRVASAAPAKPVPTTT